MYRHTLTDMRKAFNNGDAPTTHRLYQGDARSFPYVPDKSVHLVATSPPYWTLKR